MNMPPMVHITDADFTIGLNLDRLLYWEDNGAVLKVVYTIATREGERYEGPSFSGKERLQLLAYLKASSRDITPASVKELS